MGDSCGSAAKVAPARSGNLKRLAARGPIRWVRLAIQLVFLVFSPQAFSTAFAGARSIAASAASGAVLDVAGFVAALAVLCAYTVVFGRFFCGFACAFGLLGDALYAAGTLVLRLFGRERRMVPEKVEGRLRWGKYIVLALMLLLTVFGASSLVLACSPWAAFGRLVTLQPAQMGIVATVVLALVCAIMVAKERAFCTYLCPLGAVFALLPQARGARLRRDMPACTGCASCIRACPVSIYPPDDNAQMGECISCERCLDVCPEACTMRGDAAPKETARIARAVGLSLLLLVLLWACGSLNFLPTPAELTASLQPPG